MCYASLHDFFPRVLQPPVNLSATDRNNSARMFNYAANVNAQQVNNARSEGSGGLIGNTSCTTRVINISDVIIPRRCILYLGTQVSSVTARDIMERERLANGG